MQKNFQLKVNHLADFITEISTLMIYTDYGILLSNRLSDQFINTL